MSELATPVVVSWSGGKDSALLVQELAASREFRIVALLTVVTEDYDRVSMHGVRNEITRAQAHSLGLPLHEARMPARASNDVYEAVLGAALSHLRAAYPGSGTMAFGDLHLQDVRSYRESLLTRLGWRAIFPIWGLDTQKLARRFVAEGFRAAICCIDTQQLDARFAGADYDSAFLDQLPESIDPCGENGEFHSCVYDGPIFRRPLGITRGQTVRRDGRFEYCDLLLDAGDATDIPQVNK